MTIPDEWMPLALILGAGGGILLGAVLALLAAPIAFNLLIRWEKRVDGWFGR